jgi:hypothetical protein
MSKPEIGAGTPPCAKTSIPSVGLLAKVGTVPPVVPVPGGEKITLVENVCPASKYARCFTKGGRSNAFLFA